MVFLQQTGNYPSRNHMKTFRVKQVFYNYSNCPFTSSSMTVLSHHLMDFPRFRFRRQFLVISPGHSIIIDNERLKINEIRSSFSSGSSFAIVAFLLASRAIFRNHYSSTHILRRYMQYCHADLRCFENISRDVR